MATVRDRADPHGEIDTYIKPGSESARLSRTFERVSLASDITVPSTATAVYVDEAGTVICTDEEGRSVTFTFTAPGFLPIIPVAIDADSTVPNVVIAY